MEFLAFCGVVGLFVLLAIGVCVIVALIGDRITAWKNDIEFRAMEEARAEWKKTCVGLGFAKHAENSGEWRWKTDAELLAHLQSKQPKSGKK